MKIDSIGYCLRKMAAIVAIIVAAVAASSCDAVYDDLDPCHTGLRLRFVYDYNMEQANAFTSQVDCLTLLVYDAEGTFKGRYAAGRAETSDEDWRMVLDLPAGSYRLIAWGGIDCADASFVFSGNPAQMTMEELEVILPDALITSPAGTELHPLFYGAADVDVEEASDDYTEATVGMIKDTNDLRVILASASGSPLDADDFIFSITDNNTRLDYLNQVVSTDNVTYRPWAKGSSVIGETEGDAPAEVVWADFSTSRLTANSRARLTVSRRSDGSPVLSVPLVNILMLLRLNRFDNMAHQEFLDRESRWNLTFVLTGSQAWNGVSVVINGWVVRINDISDI